MAFATLILVLYRTKAKYLFQSTPKHARISKANSIINVNQFVKSLPLIFVALFFIAITTLGIAVSLNNYALANENSSTNEGTITAWVDEQTGEVTFEDAVLRNTKDYKIIIMDSILGLGEGIDDSGAIWTISLNNQIIYEGNAGQTIQLDTPIEIPANQPFTLKFASNINPQTAISLIGKTVITSKITYIPETEELPVTANIGGASISSSSSAPQGWTLKDNNYTKNYQYGTNTNLIINEWANVEYDDDFRIQGEWSANSATVGRNTVITLNWSPLRTVSGFINNLSGQPEADVTAILYNNEGVEISSATTSSDGKYVLPLHYDEGGYIKYVKYTGETSDVLVASDEPVDANTSDIPTKVIEPGYIVKGVITNPSGKGADSVEVSFKYADGGGNTQEFKTITGEDGAYSVAIKSGTNEDPIIYDYTLNKDPDVSFSNIIEAGTNNPGPINHEINNTKYDVTVDFGSTVIDESTIPKLWNKKNGSSYTRTFEKYSSLIVANIEWKNVKFTSGIPSETRFGGFDDTDKIVTDNITLNATWLPKEKDGLYKYSIDELIAISNDIANKSKLSVAWAEFYSYAINGFYRDPESGKFTGEDNSVPMGSNINAYNHWAIDKNGKLYGEDGFLDTDKNTVQCRIVGLRQFVNSKTGVAGLVFMTTHSLNTENIAYNSTSASYGWDGATEGGKSDIQRILNPENANDALVPEDLYSKITQVDIFHGVGRNKKTVVSTKNKLWCASRHEISNFTKEQSPYYEFEGNYFTALKDNGITGGNALAGLYKYQDGTTGEGVKWAAWLRSLRDADPALADQIGQYGATTTYDFVTGDYGRLVPCFALGKSLSEVKVSLDAGEHGNFYTDDECSKTVSVVQVPIGSVITSGVTNKGLNYININFDNEDHKFYTKAKDVKRYTFERFEGIPSVGKITDHLTITAVFKEIPYVPDKKLKDYTLEELKTASAYLSDESHCVDGNRTYDDFKYYLEHGITSDGSDNGTAIIEDNHWSYGADSEKVEFRIIGIHQDIKEDGTYAGLTFMATHSVGEIKYNYNKHYPDADSLAYYGWGGTFPTNNGCTLQIKMNSETKRSRILPPELMWEIVPVKKSYVTSDEIEGGPQTLSTFNKVWAPSLFEISNYSSEELPLYSSEGNYYMAFASLGHTVENYGALSNIGKNQDGTKGISNNVWLRSLNSFKATSALLINALNGYPMGSNYVTYSNGICPCFCL